ELDRSADRVGVRPEVVDDLVAVHVTVGIVAAIVEAEHGRRPVRRDQAERVPAVLPAAAERGAALQQNVLATGLAQQPADDQARVARPDDDGLHRALRDSHSYLPGTVPALDRLPGPPLRTVVGYVPDFISVARATRPTGNRHRHRLRPAHRSIRRSRRGRRRTRGFILRRAWADGGCS